MAQQHPHRAKSVTTSREHTVLPQKEGKLRRAGPGAPELHGPLVPEPGLPGGSTRKE
ncbi:hypothetical protein ZHAS_00015841 [Anopheles sinensis]|uniref:Uncharacterized protein n=1 Tax=Anopheles sinensis TaxID=74873 RepID=A0A084WC27_ANOSI|nr:hypothetical protein ZHAS_00015841 [Anopheles sinensis]